MSRSPDRRRTRSPLVAPALGALAGTALGLWLCPPALICRGAGMIGWAMVWRAWRGRGAPPQQVLALATMLLCAGLAGAPHPIGGEQPCRVDPMVTELRGRVLADPRPLEKGWFLEVGRLRDPSDRPVPGRIRVVLEPQAGQPPLPGQGLRLRGKIRPHREFRSPGSPRRARMLVARGFLGTLTLRRPAQWSRIAPGPGWLTRLRAAWRRRCRRVIEQAVPPSPRRSVVELLSLGGTAGDAAGVRELFAAAGMAHLLAISGLHVGILGLLAVGITRLARGGRRLQGAAGLVAVGLLWLLVGSRPSVARAALMGGVHLSGWVLGRRSRALNSLGLAAMLLLIREPTSLLAPGFQLTFAAVAGILVLGGRVRSSIRPLPVPWLRETLAAGVSAQLAVLPLTALHFHRFSPAAPVVAVPALPATAAVTTLGALGALLAPLWPAGSLGAYRLAGSCAEPLLGLAAGIQGTPLSAVPWPPPLCWELGVYLGLLVLWIHPVPWRTWLATAGILLLAGSQILRLLPIPVGTLECTILDAGNADALIFRWPGRCMVVDGGGSAHPRDRAARRVLVDALLHAGVRRVDQAVLTHGDSDHYGGLVELVRTLPVGEIWISSLRDLPPPALELVQAARDEGVPLREILPEMAPDLPKLGANERSLVLRLRCPGGGILLPGDLGAVGEERLVQDYHRLTSPVLKVGHHGSRSSSSPAFLGAASPGLAVISCGRGNPHGHPHPGVLRDLGSGVDPPQVLRTDLHGAVKLRWTRRGSRIWTWRGGRFRRTPRWSTDPVDAPPVAQESSLWYLPRSWHPPSPG